MSSILQTLLEMGFTEQKAKKALESSGGNSLEAAMEWLLSHADDPDEGSQKQVTQERSEKGDDAGAKDASENPVSDSNQAESGSGTEAKSIKCDECGRKFKSDAEVEFHAIKSGHSAFSESTEEVKPLTEEEKQEKMRQLEEKMRQRRLEREEKDRKDAIEREKSRRKVGMEMAAAKQRVQEEEMRKAAEARRREKIEDQLARQRILEEIQRDKDARKAKVPQEGEGAAAAPSPPPAATPLAAAAPAAPKKDYNECRLQIRLTNGQALTQTFKANEPLAAVRLYVQLNRTDGDQAFNFMTNFPKKVFTDEDMTSTLASLGLVPSAVLIVTKAQ